MFLRIYYTSILLFLTRIDYVWLRLKALMLLHIHSIISLSALFHLDLSLQLKPFDSNDNDHDLQQKLDDVMQDRIMELIKLKFPRSTVVFSFLSFSCYAVVTHQIAYFMACMCAVQSRGLMSLDSVELDGV